jgi:hypothetical protein
MRDERHVGGRRLGHRPARLHDLDVGDPLGGHAIPEHAEHARGRIDGDHPPGVKREGQRVAAAARADVQPCLARLHERAQHLEDGLIGPAGIGLKVGRHRGVEVAGRRAFAEPLGLLAIGAHAAAPCLERVRRGGGQRVGHGRSVP